MGHRVHVMHETVFVIFTSVKVLLSVIKLIFQTFLLKVVCAIISYEKAYSLHIYKRLNANILAS